MIVLVCGGREWSDRTPIEFMLRGFYDQYPDSLTVIEGGARGADRIAGQWAARYRQIGVGWVRFDAHWQGHGKRAGAIRNQEMLEYGPDVVVAFKDEFDHSLGRGGTEDMVKRAKEAGVPVYVVSHG